MLKGQATGQYVPREFEGLTLPHVDSYDYFIGEGMQRVVEGLEPMELQHPLTKAVFRAWFESPSLRQPLKEDDPHAHDQRLLPHECRESGVTYKAPFTIDLCYQLNDLPVEHMNKKMGQMPIMVKSRLCHLRHMDRAQLVGVKEESCEMGGYFICNGIERIIRMLIQQRRHYIMALKRSAYHKRGSNYTDMATLLRCVREDEQSATVRCHYLTDGTVNFAFTIRRAEFFIPAGVLLKCFMEMSDKEIFDKICKAATVESVSDAAFIADRAELLLRQAQRFHLRTRAEALEYLGSHFRGAVGALPRKTDYQVGLQLLREHIFCHLDTPSEKMNILLAMLNKLYALVCGQCSEDNPDALTHHEILLPGQLLCKFLHEKLSEGLDMIKAQITKDLESDAASVNLQDQDYIKKTSDRIPDIGRKMEYLLNTGNLVSRSGLDISQATGFTVVAEKLNFFRYLSHFRSVHRGAYFAELRTTAVRKLLPESWGFLCPVHTPDGSPCGLLNHFTAACQIVSQPPESAVQTRFAINQVLVEHGMMSIEPAITPPSPPAYVQVQVDGRVVGHLPAITAPAVFGRLQALKATALAMSTKPASEVSHLPRLQGPELNLPIDMEVVYLPYQRGGSYPGLFVFTDSARMMRPVIHLAMNTPVMIGPLEQHNLSIRCPDGGTGGTTGLKFTHAETGTGAMLSVVASLTPYSDFNQSPRNMYQCQMGKQTMGTPAQALPNRTDGKLYRIHTPQTPIARTDAYNKYNMDEFPSGTNMIVAVLAYTGYDMEDAMILNKSAVERGLAHGTVIKSESIDLRDDRGKNQKFAPEASKTGASFQLQESALGQKFPQNVPSEPSNKSVHSRFVRPQARHRESDRIDTDGLPHIGAVVYPKQAYCSKLDVDTGKAKSASVKGEEVGYVDQVTLIGSKTPGLQRVNIKMRYNRNPVIGDKFSSRHGQKGVLSQLWKDVDMPFCPATGMRPDLLINPHAFPSRMTIGMLIESLVSKAGAMAGKFMNATPFQKAAGHYQEPISSVADTLEQFGFHRNGGEIMVSGVTGEEFAAEIFIGPVYYQRLRHMVSDKFQVRSTGSVNPLTRQPIKGRKFGGGIRFGEMERDSLLAHGAAYLVHDRLHNCSDYHVIDVCSRCGSLLSTVQAKQGRATLHLSAVEADGRTPSQNVCRMCETGQHVQRVALPFVFRYLAVELAAMNIKCTMTVK